MNPFKYGQLVSGGDFCPRPKLLKELRNFITSGQNVVIQGERRIGKTSLICEAVRRLRTNKMLYVDLLEIKTSDALCKRLAKAMISLEHQAGFLEKILKKLSQLRPTVSIDPLTGQPAISVDPAVQLKPESIEGLLDLIASMHKRKTLVIVLDEFQDILNLKDSQEVLAVMRSRIQFHKKIPYVFAGSIRNKMSGIFNDPDSAFFKSAIPFDVGPLSRDKFAVFIQGKFSVGKRSIDADTMEKIFDIAVDVPGDVQQLCEALWEITSYKDKITEHHIPNALKLIYAREQKGYETALVQLSAQQLKCLVGLAKMGGQAPQSRAFLEGVGIRLPASVKKAINRLQKLKIVFEHGREYRFVNPFFGAWLRNRDF